MGDSCLALVYEGDGNRVKADFSGTGTYYIGNWYEKTGLAETKYYYFAGRRVAMRTSDGVTHIYGDHLGSATNTTSPNTATQRYFPWGARRSTTELPTPYRFTGQREESKIGLYFYNARWYDPALGRFTQPDTLVPEPGNPQALNRYSYGRNNPLTYIDDDGHLPIIPILIAGGMIALKVVDWGWTAWDSYQSLRVMNDPSASQAAKAEAAANLAMTAAFEAADVNCRPHVYHL